MAGRRTLQERRRDAIRAARDEDARRASGLPECPPKASGDRERVPYVAAQLEANIPPGRILQQAQTVWRLEPAQAELLLVKAAQFWTAARNVLSTAQHEALLDIQLQRVAHNCEIAGDTRGQVAALRERRALLQTPRAEKAELGGRMAEENAAEIERLLADLISDKAKEMASIANPAVVVSKNN